mmetsp:Transcript_45416/g.101525  ORF Transcript_45416/g.101525 Transcript_45416/m.101525 type:complete len:210 (-) Transcript_45416:96-725(-)
MGKAGKKKSAPKGFLDGQLGNIVFLAIAAGIGYCRYHQIPIPILDDLVRKALYGGSGGGGAGGADEVLTSFADAKAGKPIATSDLLGQIQRFCGSRGKCTEDYWEAIPKVAEALKKGPGTWDRKPLKKAKANELDGLLVKLAERPEARSEAVWTALRSMSKELLDVTPKSMKESLASRVTLKSSKPPDGMPVEEEPEPEKEEVAVDDLP